MSDWSNKNEIAWNQCLKIGYLTSFAELRVQTQAFFFTMNIWINYNLIFYLLFPFMGISYHAFNNEDLWMSEVFIHGNSKKNWVYWVLSWVIKSDYWVGTQNWNSTFFFEFPSCIDTLDIHKWQVQVIER